MRHILSQPKKNKSKLFVSIVIANYNGEAYLKTCLDSVLKSSYSQFEVILVDDGSTDSSLEIIQKYKKRDKRIVLVKNPKNLGAAASRNRALKYSKGEILLFLDNDTEVDRNWINEILKEFNSDDNVGGVQAVLLDFERRDIIQNAGVKLWAQSGWGLPFYQWKKYSVVKEKLPEEIIAISAALAVTREAFIYTRGFDEKESVVTEDLDLSWRLWIGGYKIKLARKSLVYHWTKGIDMRKNMKHTKKVIYYHLTKNSLISILKNYETSHAVYYFGYSILINLTRGILVFIRRSETEAIMGALQGIIWVAVHISTIIKNRTFIQEHRRSSDAVLFESVLFQKNPIYIYKHHFKQTELI